MSENKFLKNLSQQTPPPVGQDPIQRLTAELDRQSGTIEELTAVIKRLQSQPRPATYEQVKALASQAPQLDAAAVADQLRPALVAAQPVASAAERPHRWFSVPGAVLGFSSWWSMAGILGFVCLLMFVLGFGGSQQQTQIESWQQQALQARQELQAHQQFVNWLSTQKPYKNALKQYNQQVGEGAKKR